jgi:hypothetical protein
MIYQGATADEILAWMREHAEAAMTLADFVHYVTAEVLKSKLKGGQVGCPNARVCGRRMRNVLLLENWQSRRMTMQSSGWPLLPCGLH